MMMSWSDMLDNPTSDGNGYGGIASQTSMALSPSDMKNTSEVGILEHGGDGGTRCDRAVSMGYVCPTAILDHQCFMPGNFLTLQYQSQNQLPP